MAENNVLISKTCTRSSYETVEISHLWTIEKFSLRKEKVLYSLPFTSSAAAVQHQDHRKKVWTMQLFPNGVDEESKGYLSLFLTPLRGPAGPTGEELVEINISLSILDETGNCLQNNSKLNQAYGINGNFGFAKIYKREKILGKLPNDVLQIKCELSYYSEYLSGVKLDHQIEAESARDLSDSYGALLNDPEFSDVILCVGDGEEEEEKTEFRAHWTILAARSPYFAAMFKSEMREKRENRIEIKDVKPEIFREILAHIYTGKWQNNRMSENVAKEVLVAADRFVLLRLKTMAENVLASKLTFENVSELLVLSDTHSAKILKAKATEYVAANLTAVMETHGWERMIRGHPHLVKEPILRAHQGGFRK